MGLTFETKFGFDPTFSVVKIPWLKQPKIITELERNLYRDLDKIFLQNIVWECLHCNLSCTCTYALKLALDRVPVQLKFCVMKP